jgi:hypothetical protein
MFSGKLLKALIPFSAFVRFVVRGYKTQPCLVFILCIAEFDLKTSMFLTTSVDNDNVYWE